jgi:hypothetical protein
LVVVVVADEVLDGVVRQHLPQLVGQLGGQRLVRGHHQGGTVEPLDQPRGGGGLSGTRGAEQHDVLLPRPDPALQRLDRGRLIAGGLELGDDLELAGRRPDVGTNSHEFKVRTGYDIVRAPAEFR